VIGKNHGTVELHIDTKDGPVSKAFFDRLIQYKDAIEQAVGGPLEWQRLDDKRACRIQRINNEIGNRTEESQWQPLTEWMVHSMISLEKAINPYLAKIRTELPSHATGPE